MHEATRSGISLSKLSIIFLCVISLGLTPGCNEEGGSGDSADNVSPEITQAPRIELNPNGTTPLAALLTVDTNESTSVSLRVNSMGEPDSQKITGIDADTFEIDFDEFNTSHSLPVLGFRPNMGYLIEVMVIDEAGNETVSSEILEVETAPLPEGFPPIECLVSKPELMEPGVTLFNVNGQGINSGFDAIIAVDNFCNVVWYYNAGIGFGDLRRISNGNLLFLKGGGRDTIIEIDMLGNIINQWHASLNTQGEAASIPVETESFHHEIFEMKNGNFLTLSIEVRGLDNYPSSVEDPLAVPEFSHVVGDVVLEFKRDGTIVNKWSMLQMLDPYRISYSSLRGFWDSRFPELEDGTKDWSHGNGVIHDISDDSIIVSLRHQDAVIKFSRQTGELIWILGPHDNWDIDRFGQYLLSPVGDNFLFQYHQHAPQITDQGNLLLFDNGNFKASPFNTKLPPEENFSRAVEYSIDLNLLQVSQTFDYGQFTEEKLYAPALGDADSLNNGNILITYGGIATDGSGNFKDNIGRNSKVSVRIIEVTRQSPQEVVFDLSIKDISRAVENGWQTYRSERLKGLYH